MNTANILLQTLLDEFFKGKGKTQGNLSVSVAAQTKRRATRKVLCERHRGAHVIDKESEQESYPRYKKAACFKHGFHIQNPGNTRNLMLKISSQQFSPILLTEDLWSIWQEFISGQTVMLCFSRRILCLHFPWTKYAL